MRASVVLFGLLLVFVAFDVSGVPPSPDWAPLVERLACADTIEARLEAWEAGREAFRAPESFDGSERFRIPTSKLGVWITLEIGGTSRVRLVRTAAASSNEVTLDEACVEVEADLSSGVSRPSSASGRTFEDADLEAALSASPRVVVYLWTPHLPLSVEGYHQIVRAASAAEAALVAVVDPSAEPDYVREVADAEGIPAEARRVLASVELLFRNLAVHAPAIVLFEDGVARPVLPGYRSASAYFEYLTND